MGPESRDGGVAVAIVADDATGAADTGVCFSGTVGSVLLLPFGVSRNLPDDPPPSVVSVSTGTRHASPEAAAETVARTARTLTRYSPRLWYKKIDSILRGHIGAEADALLDALGLTLGFVVPAFPAMGRTTEGDVHRVHGTPVSDTEAARDPRWPVRESRLSRRIAEGSRHPVGHVGLADLRGGRDGLLARIAALRDRGARHIAFDAVVSGDLDRVARLAMHDFPDALPVGSAGLAEALARTVPVHAAADSPTPRVPARKILLVCGSASAVLADQVARLRSEHALPAAALTASELASPQAPASDSARVRGLAESWETGFVLRIRSPEPGDPLPDSDRVVQGLAEWARCLVHAGRPDGLFLSGGDTAEAVLRRLKARGVWLRGQFPPGVVAGEIHGGPAAGLRVWTKAGAFGPPEILSDLFQSLRKEIRP